MTHIPKYILIAVVIFLIIAAGIFWKDTGKRISVGDHPYENSYKSISNEPVKDISLVGSDLGFSLGSSENLKIMSDSILEGRREVRFVYPRSFEGGAPVALVSVDIVDLETIKKDSKRNSYYQSFLKGQNGGPLEPYTDKELEENPLLSQNPEWRYEYKLIGVQPYHVDTSRCEGDIYGCSLFAYTTYTDKAAITFSLGGDSGRYSKNELDAFIKKIVIK